MVAFAEGESWLRAVVAYLSVNRTLLAQLFRQSLPQVHYRVPEGTYLAWLDCRRLGIADPAAFFLERAKVALRAGTAFGASGHGWVRLNFATSRAILTKIVQSMAAAVEDAGPARQ